MKFTEILNKYNIPYIEEGSSHCRPGWVQLDCPQCGQDTQRWHLGYSLSDKYLNCWKCGSKSLIQTIKILTGLSYDRCLKLLKGIKSETQRIEIVKGKLSLPKYTNTLPHPHRHYLRGRGFDPDEIVRLWQVKGIEIASEYSWRLLIPVVYQGKIISWSTRTISKNPDIIRYIHAPKEREQIPLKTILYGNDYVRHAVIINEGFTDVWNVGPGAVATMGLGYTISQVFHMIRYPVRAVCFDRGVEAQKRAKKLCDDLSAFPGETFNVELKANDPGCASKKEIKQLRKEIFGNE